MQPEEEALTFGEYLRLRYKNSARLNADASFDQFEY